MQILIIIGAGMALLGLGCIIYSILRVLAAKRAGLDDAAMRARIQAILPWNLGGLFASVLGLMCVVVGILLG